ncbi:hypothetical protein P7K49_018632 [Saguinus oedipus]|uniref:Uncharacterized protein n=1 Tax=Saguinus oedipus TaxID=9490 RepID=A0ABQ9V6A7_SAGOE|nr:hypothetical protein P7K49_018632 [Saguinus oedipus]
MILGPHLCPGPRAGNRAVGSAHGPWSSRGRAPEPGRILMWLNIHDQEHVATLKPIQLALGLPGSACAFHRLTCLPPADSAKPPPKVAKLNKGVAWAVVFRFAEAKQEGRTGPLPASPSTACPLIPLI